MVTNRFKAATTAIAICAATVLGGTASAQEMTLRFTQPWPSLHPQWIHGGQVFIDHVTAATNGAVQFEAYHAAQLGNDNLALLKAGLADLALTSTSYASDRMPLSNVAELPGFAAGACEMNRKLRALSSEGGALYENEYKGLGLRPIYMAAPPVTSVVLGRAKAASLADLKGLKLRATGGGTLATVQALGAVPVQTVASELYDALSRGTIDGALYQFVGMPSFSLEDVFKSGIDNIHGGSLAVITFMSEKKWQSLPENVRVAMQEGALKAEQSLCSWFDENESKIRDQMIADKGFAMTSLPEADVAAWGQAQTILADDWAARMDKQGRKGTVVLDAMRQIP